MILSMNYYYYTESFPIKMTVLIQNFNANYKGKNTSEVILTIKFNKELLPY